MADTSYPQPNVATGAAYPPPNVQPVVNEPSIAAHSASAPIYHALIGAGASPDEATKLTAISGAESSFGKSPIGAPNSNGSRDYGYFQINNAAHPQMGGAAVASMPLSEQAKLALQIARSREGYGAWVTYKSGAYKNYLNGGGGAPAAPASPSTTLPYKPPPTVGNMLAGLTQPTGPSQLQQAASDVGGGGGSASQQQPEAPQNDLQGQQAAAMMGQARQQQIAAQSQQMVASMLSRGRQPLTWSAAPPGSGYGATGVPGTTLNSIGGQNG